MTSKIRWGILSTAGINRALLDPIRQATRSELVSVASRDLDRAKAYAEKENIPKAFGSYEEFLADPDIDVIYNPLPNLLHAEWTIKAAEAGKHVLCEKPIVTTLDHFDKVEAAAKANNVTVFEAFMYLHHPQTLKAIEMINKGQLGQLQQINSWFQFYLPKERSDNIRLSYELHGGSVWDVGVYPNSLAITMASAMSSAGGAINAPKSVMASQIVGETGVDVAMRSQLDFGDGLVAQIVSSFRTPFMQGAYLLGDEGKLEIPDPWKPGTNGQESRMIFTPRSGSSVSIATPAKDPYLCEVEAMEACILDGADSVLPLSTSRIFLQSVLAMLESAKTGQVVAL